MICAECQSFFVRPQTFQTLFELQRICDVCSVYRHVQPIHEVIPIHQNTLEFYTFETEIHPIVTKKAFETMLSINDALIFYETQWVKHAHSLDILTVLMRPLRLFYHKRTVAEILSALDEDTD